MVPCKIGLAGPIVAENFAKIGPPLPILVPPVKYINLEQSSYIAIIAS